jgi:hypothetical protein
MFLEAFLNYPCRKWSFWHFFELFHVVLNCFYFYRLTARGFVLSTLKYIIPEDFMLIGGGHHQPIFQSIRFPLKKDFQESRIFFEFNASETSPTLSISQQTVHHKKTVPLVVQLWNYAVHKILFNEKSCQNEVIYNEKTVHH